MVSLSYSGMDEHALEVLRRADALSFLQFQVNRGHLRRPQDSERDTFPDSPTAIAIWSGHCRDTADAAGLDEQVLAGRIPAGVLRGVLAFLFLLRASKEFAVAETRPLLAARVFEALRAIADYDDVGARTELLTRMCDSVDTCADKPVWALNQTTLLVRILRARGNRDALRALGLRIMRLSIVHDHAALRFVDDVCVHLRFQIDLRDAFDLPVSTAAMVFPGYISIADAELAAARNEALAISDSDVASWLRDWPERRRQLCHEFADTQQWRALPAAADGRRRLSLRNVFGGAMHDPVRIDDRARVLCSLADILTHWVPTGMDLDNVVTSVQDMRQQLRRIAL